MKNDQRGGIYSLFGPEMMESGYLQGLGKELVHVPEGTSLPPWLPCEAEYEKPDLASRDIRADCLSSPPDRSGEDTPDPRNGNEQLIAPIFLGAHGGHSGGPEDQSGIAPGQSGRPCSPNNGIIPGSGHLNS